MSERKIEIIRGEPVKSRWGQWHRHDQVKVDGCLLQGSLFTRRRYYGKRIGHRIECHTGIGRACVTGHHLNWLIANQNTEFKS